MAMQSNMEKLASNKNVDITDETSSEITTAMPLTTLPMSFKTSTTRNPPAERLNISSHTSGEKLVRNPSRSVDVVSNACS